MPAWSYASAALHHPIGLSVRPVPGALLHARIGASTDGVTQPDLNFGIGAAFAF